MILFRKRCNYAYAKAETDDDKRMNIIIKMVGKLMPLSHLSSRILKLEIVLKIENFGMVSGTDKKISTNFA